MQACGINRNGSDISDKADDDLQKSGHTRPASVHAYSIFPVKFNLARLVTHATVFKHPCRLAHSRTTSNHSPALQAPAQQGVTPLLQTRQFSLAPEIRGACAEIRDEPGRFPKSSCKLCNATYAALESAIRFFRQDRDGNPFVPAPETEKSPVKPGFSKMCPFPPFKEKWRE